MMPEVNRHTFVGFGFGPIQAGLFLHEAAKSGNFDRLVVAEVNPALVSDVRQNNGRVDVNIAHQDHLETVKINGIEIYNPNHPEDRIALIEAISEAHEMATAVPSVNFYKNESPGSIHRLLAHGLFLKNQQDGPDAVIYTAENNNHAAEALEHAIREAYLGHYLTELQTENVLFLNTVIGKMSQVVTLGESVIQHDLIPIVPRSDKAILVEAFNRILITKISFQKLFRRGIIVFQEKQDLLPFEEAKLFGHNAVHASLGFLGKCLGENVVSELKNRPRLITFLRAMFIDEIGAALCRKYQGVDKLFTDAGFHYFAEDLLERMLNPYLMDATDRLTRDIERKLGWHDRLIGAIRVCLNNGVHPKRLAFCVAAAMYISEQQNVNALSKALNGFRLIWEQQSDSKCEVEDVVALIKTGIKDFTLWQKQVFNVNQLI